MFGSFLNKIVLLSYFKINSKISFLQDVLKTSRKRLEDVLKTYDQDVYILEDVLKTSFEDEDD